MADRAIIDASAMVDLLVGSAAAGAVEVRLRNHELHAPAHFDAEVLSALGRLHRAGHLTAEQATVRVNQLAASPIKRHGLTPLVAGAWRRRHNTRLVDALYVELADQLESSIVITDNGMAAASPRAELLIT